MGSTIHYLVDGFADCRVIRANSELHGDLLGRVNPKGEADKDLCMAHEHARQKAGVRS